MHCLQPGLVVLLALVGVCVTPTNGLADWMEHANALTAGVASGDNKAWLPILQGDTDDCITTGAIQFDCIAGSCNPCNGKIEALYSELVNGGGWGKSCIGELVEWHGGVFCMDPLTSHDVILRSPDITGTGVVRVQVAQTWCFGNTNGPDCLDDPGSVYARLMRNINGIDTIVAEAKPEELTSPALSDNTVAGFACKAGTGCEATANGIKYQPNDWIVFSETDGHTAFRINSLEFDEIMAPWMLHANNLAANVATNTWREDGDTETHNNGWIQLDNGGGNTENCNRTNWVTHSDAPCHTYLFHLYDDLIQNHDWTTTCTGGDSGFLDQSHGGVYCIFGSVQDLHLTDANLESPAMPSNGRVRVEIAVTTCEGRNTECSTCTGCARTCSVEQCFATQGTAYANLTRNGVVIAMAQPDYMQTPGGKGVTYANFACVDSTSCQVEAGGWVNYQAGDKILITEAEGHSTFRINYLEFAEPLPPTPVPTPPPTTPPPTTPPTPVCNTAAFGAAFVSEHAIASIPADSADAEVAFLVHVPRVGSGPRAVSLLRFVSNQITLEPELQLVLEVSADEKSKWSLSSGNAIVLDFPPTAQSSVSYDEAVHTQNDEALHDAARGLWVNISIDHSNPSSYTTLLLMGQTAESVQVVARDSSAKFGFIYYAKGQFVTGGDWVGSHCSDDGVQFNLDESECTVAFLQENAQTICTNQWSQGSSSCQGIAALGVILGPVHSCGDTPLNEVCTSTSSFGGCSPRHRFFSWSVPPIQTWHLTDITWNPNLDSPPATTSETSLAFCKQINSEAGMLPPPFSVSGTEVRIGNSTLNGVIRSVTFGGDATLATANTNFLVDYHYGLNSDATTGSALAVVPIGSTSSQWDWGDTFALNAGEIWHTTYSNLTNGAALWCSLECNIENSTTIGANCGTCPVGYTLTTPVNANNGARCGNTDSEIPLAHCGWNGVIGGLSVTLADGSPCRRRHCDAPDTTFWARSATSGLNASAVEVDCSDAPQEWGLYQVGATCSISPVVAGGAFRNCGSIECTEGGEWQPLQPGGAVCDMFCAYEQPPSHASYSHTTLGGTEVALTGTEIVCNPDKFAPNGTVCSYTLTGHDCTSIHRCNNTEWVGDVTCTPSNCTLDCGYYPETDDTHPLFRDTSAPGSNRCHPNITSSIPQTTVTSGSNWTFTAPGHDCDSQFCLNGTIFTLTDDNKAALASNSVTQLNVSAMARCVASSCPKDDLESLNKYNATVGTTCDSLADGNLLGHGKECLLLVPGYNCNGSQTCNFGNWNVTGPECTPKRCVFDFASMTPLNFSGGTIICDGSVVAHGTNVSVASGKTCSMNRPGYVCNGEITCEKSEWQGLHHGRIGECDTEQRCNISALDIVSNETSTANIECQSASVAGDGITCTFINPQYNCPNTTCSLGNWSTTMIDCTDPRACKLDIDLSDEVLSVGANWTNCTKGEEYAHGTVCKVDDVTGHDGHTCGLVTCDRGQFITEDSEPVSCLADSCTFNKTLMTPATPGFNNGPTSSCGDQDDVPSGHMCTYERIGYNCTPSATDSCHAGQWTHGSSFCKPDSCTYNETKDFAVSDFVVGAAAREALLPESSCDNGQTMATGESCNFTLKWHQCEATTCHLGYFSVIEPFPDGGGIMGTSDPSFPTKAKCEEDGCVWTTEWLRHLPGVNTSSFQPSSSPWCTEGGNISSGGECSVSLNGYDCSPGNTTSTEATLYCRLGRWWRRRPTPSDILHSENLYFGDGIWNETDVSRIANETRNFPAVPWDVDQTFMPRCETPACRHSDLLSHQLNMATPQCSNTVWSPSTAPYHPNTSDSSVTNFCKFTKDGHNCDALECVDGIGWRSPTVQCFPDDCPQTEMNLDVIADWGQEVSVVANNSHVCLDNTADAKSGQECHFQVVDENKGRQYICQNRICTNGSWYPDVGNATFRPCEPKDCFFNNSLLSQYKHPLSGTSAISINCTEGEHNDTTICATHLEDFVCKDMQCQASIWIPPAPGCTPQVCHFDTTVQRFDLPGAPSWWLQKHNVDIALVPTCDDSKEWQPGENCTTLVVGHTCDTLECIAGKTWFVRNTIDSRAALQRQPKTRCLPHSCNITTLLLNANASGANVSCLSYTNGSNHTHIESNSSCIIDKIGHQCKEVVCYAGSLSEDTAQCDANPCLFSPLNIPAGANVAPGVANCSIGSKVQSGEACEFIKDGHTCTPITCHEGKFQEQAVCSPDACPVSELQDHSPPMPEQPVTFERTNYAISNSEWDALLSVIGASGLTTNTTQAICTNSSAYVDSGGACQFVAANHSCTLSRCINGSWQDATCEADTCSQQAPSPPGAGIGTCTANSNGRYTSGTSCTHVRDGYNCPNSYCVRGSWFPINASCDQLPCNLSGISNTVTSMGGVETLPQLLCRPEASMSGEETPQNYSGQVQAGHICTAQIAGFECTSAKCSQGVFKLGTRPSNITCTELTCNGLQLVNTGNNATCTSGLTDHGVTCTANRQHFNCTSSECMYGNFSSPEVKCEPLKCSYNVTLDAPSGFQLDTIQHQFWEEMIQGFGTGSATSSTNCSDPVQPGVQCMFNKSGHVCDAITCEHERFAHRLDATLQPTCKPLGCPWGENGGSNLKIESLVITNIAGKNFTSRPQSSHCDGIANENGGVLPSGTVCPVTIGNGNKYACTTVMCAFGLYNATSITCPEPSCLYTAEHRNDADDSPECELDTLYGSGDMCQHSKEGYTCSNSTCIWDGFDPPRVGCSVNPCDYDASLIPTNADTNCTEAVSDTGTRKIGDGDTCVHTLAGHTCDTVVCGEVNPGQLNPLSPKCHPNNCTYLSSLELLPQDAHTNCTEGQGIVSGDRCGVTLHGHDCGSLVCNAGNFTLPQTLCAPKKCSLDPLSVAQRGDKGMTLGGDEGCGGNFGDGTGQLPNGTRCDVLRTGYDCGEFICVRGNMTAVNGGATCTPKQCDVHSIADGLTYRIMTEFYEQTDRQRLDGEQATPVLAQDCNRAWVSSNTTCGMTYEHDRFLHNCGVLTCNLGEWVYGKRDEAQTKLMDEDGENNKITCLEARCDFVAMLQSLPPCTACPNQANKSSSDGVIEAASCGIMEHTGHCKVWKDDWDCDGGDYSTTKRQIQCFAGLVRDKIITTTPLADIYTDNTCVKITDAPTFSPSVAPSVAPSYAPSVAPSFSPSFSPTQQPTLEPGFVAPFARSYLEVDPATGKDVSSYTISDTLSIPHLSCNDFLGDSPEAKLQTLRNMTKTVVAELIANGVSSDVVDVLMVKCNGTVATGAAPSTQRRQGATSTPPSFSTNGVAIPWSATVSHTMLSQQSLALTGFPNLISAFVARLGNMTSVPSSTTHDTARTTVNTFLASPVAAPQTGQSVFDGAASPAVVQAVVDASGCANIAIRISCASLCELTATSVTLPSTCAAAGCTLDDILAERAGMQLAGLGTCMQVTPAAVNTTVGTLNENQTTAMLTVLEDATTGATSGQVSMSTTLSLGCNGTCSHAFEAAIADGLLAEAVAMSVGGSVSLDSSQVVVTPVLVDSGDLVYNVSIIVPVSNLDDAVQSGYAANPASALASLQEGLDLVATPHTATERDVSGTQGAVAYSGGWHNPIIAHLVTGALDLGVTVAAGNSTFADVLSKMAPLQLADASYTTVVDEGVHGISAWIHAGVAGSVAVLVSLVIYVGLYGGQATGIKYEALFHTDPDTAAYGRTPIPRELRAKKPDRLKV